MLARHNVYHYSMASDTKAAIVERFNCTLKDRMWRYLTHKQELEGEATSRRYIDVLQQLVDSYNRKVHRSIGMAPTQVSKRNEAQLWQKQFGKEKPQQQHKFQIGDRVRLAKKMNPFSKGYKGNWTREVFTVKEINRLHHFPMFYLEDDKGEPIKG